MDTWLCQWRIVTYLTDCFYDTNKSALSLSLVTLLHDLAQSLASWSDSFTVRPKIVPLSLTLLSQRFFEELCQWRIVQWRIVPMKNCANEELCQWRIVSMKNCAIEELCQWRIVSMKNCANEELCQENYCVNEELCQWKIQPMETCTNEKIVRLV